MTYLEECYSDDKYNVYFFHESFIFVSDNEMIKVLKKDLYDNCDLNYTQYPKLIKEIILDGDQGITCLYAEFYLKENDENIKTGALFDGTKIQNEFNKLLKIWNNR